ncbi:MAG: SGNH/GDSL hydrolase family protein [Ruminococcus sp.]|nr:SGNH/GDSL hydrolase family protein [Ruminococcus sp.]
MTTIELTAKDQEIAARSKPVVASGNQNTVAITVDYSPEWDGYVKTAVFFTENDPTAYEVAMVDDKFIVPHEVLEDVTKLYIGLRGVNGDEVKTSSLVKYSIVKGTPIGEGTAVDATPTPYQQVLSRTESLQGQINEIVIEATDSGDASAEVAQARIPEYGAETFPTLQARLNSSDAQLNAVQIGKADREELEKLTVSEMPFVSGYIPNRCETGTIDVTTGIDTDDETRIRTIGYIPNIGSRIVVTLSADVKCRAVYYKSDLTVLRASPDWSTHDVIKIKIQDDTEIAYVRLVFAFSDDRKIENVSDIESLITVRYDNHPYTYNGRVADHGRTSFAECSKPGCYGFSSTDLPILTDKPDISDGGILRVEINAAADVVFQTICTKKGFIYFRYGSNEFTRMNALYTQYFLARGNAVDLGYSSLAECTTEGTYQITSANISELSDCPSKYGGILKVYRGFSAVVLLQEYTDTRGNTYQRYMNATEFSQWIQTGKNITTTAGSAVWYALGDSITQGYYSYIGDNGKSAIAVTQNNWVNTVANAKGYTLTNHGVGGSGYVHNGTVLDKLNARDHVNTIDFSGADIVTLAYGINDWKGNDPLGTFNDDIATGGTFYSNMRYVIEKILGDNPLCKIFIITPINASRYGTEVGNWSLSFPRGADMNGDRTEADDKLTLQDFFNAEKEVAEYYGLELIDMTHDSCVNRLTAPHILIDGVHPSLDGHKAMGRELADKINYF